MWKIVTKDDRFPWPCTIVDDSDRSLLGVLDETPIVRSRPLANKIVAALNEDSRLRDAVFQHHSRVPSDSPFNAEGRDVCGTCMDGEHPADWPCPTYAALEVDP